MRKFTPSVERNLHQAGSGASVHLERAIPYPLKGLARIPPLSKEAMVRFRFLEFSRDHSVSVTSRRFGISRSTFYRWKKRYRPFHLKSLENHSRRPKNLRKNRWSLEEIEKVRELREEYPSWGKAKLVISSKERGSGSQNPKWEGSSPT